MKYLQINQTKYIENQTTIKLVERNYINSEINSEIKYAQEQGD